MRHRMGQLLAGLLDEVERLRAAMWKYGKHLNCCAVQAYHNHHPMRSCDCGWVQIRETLAGEAKRPTVETETLK